MSKQLSSPNRVVTLTYLSFAVLIVVWIGAWLGKVALEQKLDYLATATGSFLYWTTAKVIIWILPALLLMKTADRRVGEVFNLSQWKRWLLWGGGIGLLIALTAIIPNYLQGKRLLPTQFSFPLLNVLVIAPTFEEFLMRGAILGNLQKKYAFWTANVITSVLFVALHVPGWYFMGVLWDNLTQPVGGALSVFLVSLGFGYATYRGGSVMGGILSHFLNNLF